MVSEMTLHHERCSIHASHYYIIALVQRSVWMVSQNQDWWDREVSGFSETDLIHNLGTPTATFNNNVA